MTEPTLLPGTIYAYREFVEIGGLVASAFDQAEAVGLTIPPSLLARVDKIVQ